MKKLTIEQRDALIKKIKEFAHPYIAYKGRGSGTEMTVTFEAVALDTIEEIIKFATEQAKTYVDIPDQNGKTVRVFTSDREG